MSSSASASPVLVTGAAGFIGYHVAARLLAMGRTVLGVDCLTPYYDVALKRARLADLAGRAGFTPVEIDLADATASAELFARHRVAEVVHLAAQPGVRAALTEPRPYVERNVVAFLNVLEGCRHAGTRHLVYASSSSVYGLNATRPFSEHHGTDHPASLYAATKKANEAMAHAYAHLFGLPATGLRFFTVYGPWGRPDMAVYAFTHAIARGRPIEVAADGEVWRDFTYVDDVVEGVVRVLARPPVADPHGTRAMPIPPPRARRTASTTSATTGRKSSTISLPGSRPRWVARRPASPARCHRAMSSRPARTSPISRRRSGSPRRPRWTRA